MPNGAVALSIPAFSPDWFMRAFDATLDQRELRRRSAIEAVIGHMKMDGHLGRCYLKGREGDAANAILSAVGYNLRLVLAWLRILLSLILLTLSRAFAVQLLLTRAS